jgi:hypothetical protein
MSSLPALSNELVALIDLVSLQWKSRIIIINEVENNEVMLALFEKNSVEIDGRDLTWFVFYEQQVLSNYPDEISDDLISYTKQRYMLKQSEIILIGKDNDIKRRLDRVDLNIIFSEIDSMSTRQNEMQN